jgi:hypothetical protein
MVRKRNFFVIDFQVCLEPDFRRYEVNRMIGITLHTSDVLYFDDNNILDGRLFTLNKKLLIL